MRFRENTVQSVVSEVKSGSLVCSNCVTHFTLIQSPLLEDDLIIVTATTGWWTFGIRFEEKINYS